METRILHADVIRQAFDQALRQLAGELDAKFVAEARDIATTLPRGSFAHIVGAGHAAHLELPEQVTRAIEAFLS